MNARHVVLMTYGEPPTPAVTAQLRYSWRILLGLTRKVADIPPALLPVIALSRARTRNRLWRYEHYASPLEPITREQARVLTGTLASHAPETGWRVHVAYEFRDPLLPRVLDGIPEDEPVDVVPMYVADSAFTHEISRDTVRAWGERRRALRPAPVRVLPAMDEERLAEVLARHITRELASRDVPAGTDCALVLAAHGTLLEPPRPMETGRAATERVYQAIVRRLSRSFGLAVNGWLNHRYGGRWTEPPVEESLRTVLERGCRRAVYFPYGFLADNAESELEGRQALRGEPDLEAVHLPCVNASAEFIEALAEYVLDHVRARSGHSTAPAAGAGRPVVTIEE